MSEITEEKAKSLNFIEQQIINDIESGKNNGEVYTRFPPEPNGYLHIGHAKSICLNFGLGQKFNGKTNLRFDDTNPEKENDEYVQSIISDVKWLGFNWEGEPRYTSSYFDQLYEWAVKLIKNGKAYVCDLNPDDFSENYRGTPTVPGKESPYRSRSIDENIDLFERMKDGEFKTGEKVLRAKIDMTSPNMHMRDPVIYRIKHAHHHRTGDKWCIYPMYDFAHGQSDYIERITHSICTLEFEVHRPLYEWLLNEIAEENETRKPRQIEFARLNLTYTVMSKRKLLELVEANHVNSWDDPRMPTISGMRRRGYTPTAIRDFADKVGVAKRENMIDIALLEHCVREDLNKVSARAMVVMDPLKVTITNYPEDKEELLPAVNNPEDESMGTREVPFSNTLYIEQADFMENAPRKFFRLTEGKEVRLRYAYFFTCNEVIKDETGKVIELKGTIDPESKGGKSPDGRKVKGTLHWVSAKHAVEAEARLYDRLFTVENPADAEEGKTFLDYLNKDSLTKQKCYLEPSLVDASVEAPIQFERIGYFTKDKDSTENNIVFNRTVALRDTWAKKNK